MTATQKSDADPRLGILSANLASAMRIGDRGINDQEYINNTSHFLSPPVMRMKSSTSGSSIDRVEELQQTVRKPVARLKFEYQNRQIEVKNITHLLKTTNYRPLKRARGGFGVVSKAILINESGVECTVAIKSLFDNKTREPLIDVASKKVRLYSGCI